MGYIRWNGKKFYPQKPKPYKPDINELMKPLSEKVGKGNIWGSVIMNVEKDDAVPVSPTPTPTITPTITPTPTLTSSPTPTPTLTPTSSPITFSPADLTGLWDWWRADTNVGIVSGNEVDSWTGYSGNVLSVVSGNQHLISADTDFNNEPSIWFNSGNTRGMRTSISSSAASDKTIIMVCKTTSSRATASDLNSFFVYNLDTAPRAAIFGKVSTSEYMVFESSIGTSDIIGSNFIDYNIIMWKYNRTTGLHEFYTNNTADLSTLSYSQTGPVGANFNSQFLFIGDYNNLVNVVGGRFKCVEIIALDALPSPTEITNLETYLSNRYGI